MLSATLGGLIKDYRLKKRLSQLEVSLRIGWSDATRLSKIEQGRVGKPTRETVEKIIKALELNEIDKNHFLFSGGYLPNDDEIEKMRKVFKEMINNWSYPAYLVDYSWRLVFANNITFGIMKDREGMKKNYLQSKPNILEANFARDRYFDSSAEKGDTKENLYPFLLTTFVRFKVEQQGRENELWYKTLMAKLMKDPRFRELWIEADPSKYDKLLLDYEYKIIKYYDQNITLRFHVSISRVTQDERFRVYLHYPADEFTNQYFRKLSTN